MWLRVSSAPSQGSEPCRLPSVPSVCWDRLLLEPPWWFSSPWPPSPSFGGQRTHTSSCSTSCPSALERSDEWRGGASGAGGSRSTSQAWRCRTPATHRVLCGQRTTSSALEFSAAARVLGRSKSCRASDSGLGAPETYEDAKRQRTGTATRHTLNSRRCWRRIRSHAEPVAAWEALMRANSLGLNDVALVASDTSV